MPVLLDQRTLELLIKRLERMRRAPMATCYQLEHERRIHWDGIMEGRTYMLQWVRKILKEEKARRLKAEQHKENLRNLYGKKL